MLESGNTIIENASKGSKRLQMSGKQEKLQN